MYYCTVPPYNQVTDAATAQQKHSSSCITVQYSFPLRFILESCKALPNVFEFKYGKKQALEFKMKEQ
jgi:hypothetical protein